MAAQPYLLEGKLFGPREALELGWVDGLGASADELRTHGARLDRRQPRRDPAVGPARLQDARRHAVEPEDRRRLAVAPAMLAQKTRGLYPAPQAILETMVEGALVDYDTATRIESRKLAKLMVGQTTPRT